MGRSSAARGGRAFASLCALAHLFGAAGCSEPASSPPNVVLIVLDTLRADALSVYGHPLPTSPRLDGLAREGAHFTRAFSTDFWTLPSHASLLTGRYPGEVGATSETNRLPDPARTLAELLGAAGFRTAGFVTNAWLTSERGFDQGFDVYQENWRSAPAGSDTYSLDRIGVEAASAWLAEVAGSEEPFFLFLNLNSVHLPYAPDPLSHVDLFPGVRPADQLRRLKAVKGMWAHLAGELPLSEDDYAVMRELYAAEVKRLDALVGRLLDRLEALGLIDETLVIVTADHGENIGDHGMIDHLFSMHDTTLHVPLIVRYPARFEAGSVRDELVSLIDVLPTVVDVTGVDLPPVSGASLAPDGFDRRTFVVAENDRPMNGIDLMAQRFPDFDVSRIDHRVRTIRTADHKLIWRDDGTRVLYDLRADPDEQVAITDRDVPEMVELISILEAWQAEHEPASSPRRRLESADEAAEAELRALGYIE